MDTPFFVFLSYWPGRKHESCKWKRYLQPEGNVESNSQDGRVTGWKATGLLVIVEPSTVMFCLCLCERKKKYIFGSNLDIPHKFIQSQKSTAAFIFILKV